MERLPRPSAPYDSREDTTMATTAETLFGRAHRARPRPGGRPLRGNHPLPPEDNAASDRDLLGSCVAATATGLVLLGLGLVLVAEYALVWVLLFAPWIDTLPVAGSP